MDTSRHNWDKPLSELSSSDRHDWQHLAESICANYSLFPGWTEITARSHGIGDDCRVSAVYQAQKMVAVFPTMLTLIRVLGMRLRLFDLVSNLVSYHNSPVSSLDPELTLLMLLEKAALCEADVLRLSAIPNDSRIGMYLGRQNAQTPFVMHSIQGEASPYLPLPTTWDELLVSKPKKFRYKVRKRAETLDTYAGLRMQWFDSQEDCQRFLEAIRKVEENSWKKDAGISIFDSEIERRYYELLLPFLSSQKVVLCNVLFLRDIPIAYNLSCLKNGWAGQLKTSFDSRYAELSPGSLVIDFAIRRALELGAAEFDFLGNKDAHKLAWTKSVRSHTDYYLYLSSSLRGRTVGQLQALRHRLSKLKNTSIPADFP